MSRAESRNGESLTDARLEARPNADPRAAGLALAVAFADALAGKPDLAAAVAEALARAIESGLLSGGCLFEAGPDGGLALRAQAGLAGADAPIRALCHEAWRAEGLVAAGQPLPVPAPGLPADLSTEALRRAGATSALLLPLVAGGTRVGLLLLAARDLPLDGAGVVAGARVVAAQLARALADARARAQRDAESRLQRAAFDHARDAILVLDDDGRLLAANDQAERVFDRAVSELIGRRPLDLVVPDDVHVMNALRAQLVAQGSLDVHRMRICRPDGRVTDVDATASRVPGGEGFVRVLVLRDMTNRRSAREGLAAGEERFRAVVESTGDTIFTLDRSLRVTGVFGRCPADAGLDACGCVGKPLREALGATADAHEPAARQALAGEVVTFEWTTPGADATRHLQTTFSPVRASDGEVRGLVGVTRDVTDRRQLQARLLVANHMAALGLMAGSVSQELSTPVAAVLTNLSHVNRVLTGANSLAAAGERAVELATIMHLADPVRDALAAADQLRGIVQDLRTFTRTNEERLGAVDVGQVLDTAVRMAATELKGRARVVRHYHDVPPVLGNEARLVQVFLSLVVNAAQACPERGEGRHEVRLSTGRDDAGRVVVEVRDTGRGIAPEDLGRIFEPFYTTKPPGVGTGLGLSIAQRIVHVLGGEISVATDPGKGTTVRVVLPAAEGVPHRLDAESSERVPPGPLA